MVKVSLYSIVLDTCDYWVIALIRYTVLSQVGISKDTSLRVSVDIPTRDNVHQYQCNNLGFTAQSTQWGHVERGQFA